MLHDRVNEVKNIIRFFRFFQWIPLYYFRAERLYEQQGNTAKAIENYEKFLTLWKDADPGIAEVEEAKKRLVELQNQ